jgi:hypothetical protein
MIWRTGRQIMSQIAQNLSADNIDQMIERHTDSIRALAVPIAQLTGLSLSSSLKRTPARIGPYPRLSLFEAAHRIMSDLVMLHGVKWLLKSRLFPFEAYRVERGRRGRGSFDVVATNDSGARLVGGALNVSRSFFQRRKRAMLDELAQERRDADFRVLMVNHDALGRDGIRALPTHQWLLAIDVQDGAATAIRG